VGPLPDFDTVILAGGSASRLGGMDKPSMAIAATPMLVSVSQAAAEAGTSRLILVGPSRGGSVQDALVTLAAGRTGWLTWVQEQPAGSGPVAGLRRGLAEATAAWLVLLAADLPFLTAAHLTALFTANESAGIQPDLELLAAAGSSSDAVGPRGGVGARAAGVVAVDLAGHPQWLISCWRVGALRAALAAYAGGSLRGVLAPLNPATIRLPVATGNPPPWLDCDTPDDLAAARRAWLAHAAECGG
jgi:molybdopterin-guanine dinucleotide biosynthesis protein A